MPGASDLVIRVLADTSQAEGALSSLGGTVGKALGIGAAGIAADKIVQNAESYQSAMAKIAQADASFTPGTAKYEQAQQTIEKFTTTLATNFEDVAGVMAMAAKVTDQYGNKLPIDKVNELTDASIRLQKASQGSLDAITAIQDQSMLSKIFNTQDFGSNANAIAALSQQHPQNEGSLLDAAIAIGQGGSALGVTEQQALGLGNYLSDIGLGGEMGGSSITRTLQRMNTAADQTLDPEQQYSDLKKHRDATEKLSDLQGQLEVAQQRHAQMYGQHGLKTQYRRDPAALMASDQEIAKLQREISDTQQDNAHLDDAKNKASRGTVDIAMMAGTAGMDTGVFAQEFKDNPVQALLDFTRGVHDLPVQQREAALSKAGITNVRDIRTLMGLSDQPGSAQRQIDLANNPGSALNTISQLGLDTTASKQADAGNLGRNAIVNNGGDQARQGLDAVLDQVLKFGQSVQDDTGGLQQFGIAMGGALGTMAPFLGAAAPGVISKLMSRGGSAAEGVAGAGGGAAEAVAGGGAADAGVLGISGAGLGTSLLGGGLMTAAALVSSEIGKDLAKGSIDSILSGSLGPDIQKFAQDHLRSSSDVAQSPNGVQIGDIHVQAGYSLQDVINAVTEHITAAWNAAQNEHPITGQIGGDYTTGQGPR